MPIAQGASARGCPSPAQAPVANTTHTPTRGWRLGAVGTAPAVLSRACIRIGRFARAAVSETRAAYPGPSLARYSAHVVVPRVVETEIAVLKGIMGQAIVTIEARKGVYKEQRRVLKRLADALWSTDALWNAGADVLEPAYAADFSAAQTDAERARVVVDQVASLTDQTAVDWHNRLVAEMDPAEVGIWTPRHPRPGAVVASAAGEVTGVIRRLGEPVQVEPELLAQLRDAGVMPGAIATLSAAGSYVSVQVDGFGDGLELPNEVAAHIYVEA